jgi:hypothetical protein
MTAYIPRAACNYYHEISSIFYLIEIEGNKKLAINNWDVFSDIIKENGFSNATTERHLNTI